MRPRTRGLRKACYVAAGLLMMSLTVAACGNSGSTGGSSSAKSNNLGLLAGSHITAAALDGEVGFSTETSGQWSGFSISLLEQLADNLGVGSGITYTGFQEVPPMEAAVGSHQYDVCACALTITAAREKINGFTEPYYWGFSDLLAKKGSGITSLSQLNGQTVGVGIGTEQQSFLQQNDPKITLKTYDNPSDAIIGLIAGQVSAALVGGTSVTTYEKTYPTLSVVADVPQTQAIGFPVPKGDTALTAALNKEITASINDGSWLKLYRKEFPGEPVVAPFLKLYPQLVKQGA